MSKRRNTENSNEEENIIPNNEVESTSEVNTETTEPTENNEEVVSNASGLEADEVVIDEPVGIVVGSKVKVHKDVGTDIIGRRIHNGIKNYTYTVKVVRPDGFITIECMTYEFTVAMKDVDLV